MHRIVESEVCHLNLVRQYVRSNIFVTPLFSSETMNYVRPEQYIFEHLLNASLTTFIKSQIYALIIVIIETFDQLS